MRTLILITLAALLCGSLFAADPVWISKRNDAGVIELTAVGIVPVTSTTLTSTEYRVKAITLVNDTAASVTCAVKDKSTNCNGAACAIVPSATTRPLTLATATMYVIQLPGIPATGGITWSCSATGVTGRVTVSQ